MTNDRNSDNPIGISEINKNPLVDIEFQDLSYNVTKGEYIVYLI